MSQLTSEQILSVTNLLKQLEPGFLPLEIFNQIARLVRLPIVDIIPIKWEGSTLSVGLLQRAKDDLWWPEMWHVPGTVLRSTDTMAQAQQRLLSKEIKIESSDPPVFHNFVVHHSQRGAEIVFIHSIQNCVFQASSPIQWFPVDQLPENCIDSEKQIIKKLSETLPRT